MSAVTKRYVAWGVLILLVVAVAITVVGIGLTGTAVFGYNAMSFGFQLIFILAYGMAWDKVANTSPKNLPVLYVSASGLRLLFAAAFLVVYMFADRATGNLPLFAIIFVAYYIIILIYDTTYFVSAEKKRLR